MLTKRLFEILAASLMAVVFLTACASSRSTTLESQKLSFLEDSVTTKGEVLLRFGLPSAQFEGERILTYRLQEEEEFVVVSREINWLDPRFVTWERSQFNLVLVFDDHHVLQKHTLLKVR